MRVAGPADAELVGSIHARAFATDPVMTWVFREPDPMPQLDAVWRFLAVEALVPLGHTYLIGGACAAWTPPDAPPWPAERGERFAEVLAAACHSDEVGRLRTLNDLLDAHHPGEPLWYLGSVATVPEAQGQGLGSRLLTESLAAVDSSGLPAYLEATTPRSVPLYQRHGFAAVGTITLPDGPTLVAMRRQPAD